MRKKKNLKRQFSCSIQVVFRHVLKCKWNLRKSQEPTLRMLTFQKWWRCVFHGCQWPLGQISRVAQHHGLSRTFQIDSSSSGKIFNSVSFHLIRVLVCIIKDTLYTHDTTMNSIRLWGRGGVGRGYQRGVHRCGCANWRDSEKAEKEGKAFLAQGW
jgi:hypothetical protein